MATVLRDAKTGAARLQFADRARSEGDIRSACRVYLRLALSRTATPATVVARQRLLELKQEARQKVADVEGRLRELTSASPGEQNSNDTFERLSECMSDFDKLAKQYGRVPEVGRVINSSLSKQKKHPQVRAALGEPEASLLWDEAQQLEREGQVCCAFQLYEEALRLLPAPSARAAEQRLAHLKSDPQQVAAADACRNLQWCHERYRLASRVAKVQPKKAREMFQQIVQRAPVDSRIYQDAKSEIGRLSDGTSSSG
jgi:hypothetical protein